MIYLLDTNACIVYLNGRNLNLRRRIENTPSADIAVCSIELANFSFYRSQELTQLAIVYYRDSISTTAVISP